jgi:hypothetical protein
MSQTKKRKEEQSLSKRKEGTQQNAKYFSVDEIKFGKEKEKQEQEQEFIKGARNEETGNFNPNLRGVEFMYEAPQGMLVEPEEKVQSLLFL